MTGTETLLFLAVWAGLSWAGCTWLHRREGRR